MGSHLWMLERGAGRAKDTKFFGALYKQMADGGRAALLHTHQTYDLRDVNLRDIPNTDALFYQKLRGADPLEAWWYERLTSGAQLPGREWAPTGRLWHNYLYRCKSVGVHRALDREFFARKLKEMVPGVARNRRTYVPTPEEADEPGGQDLRPWGYGFPALECARASFEEIFNVSIDWESEQGENTPP